MRSCEFYPFDENVLLEILGRPRPTEEEFKAHVKPTAEKICPHCGQKIVEAQDKGGHDVLAYEE